MCWRIDDSVRRESTVNYRVMFERGDHSYEKLDADPKRVRRCIN